MNSLVKFLPILFWDVSIITAFFLKWFEITILDMLYQLLLSLCVLTIGKTVNNLNNIRYEKLVFDFSWSLTFFGINCGLLLYTKRYITYFCFTIIFLLTISYIFTNEFKKYNLHYYQNTGSLFLRKMLMYIYLTIFFPFLLFHKIEYSEHLILMFSGSIIFNIIGFILIQNIFIKKVNNDEVKREPFSSLKLIDIISAIFHTLTLTYCLIENKSSLSKIFCCLCILLLLNNYSLSIASYFHFRDVAQIQNQLNIFEPIVVIVNPDGDFEIGYLLKK